MEMGTFFALASGELAAEDAIEEGRVRLEGDPDTLARCFRVFSFAPRVSASAAGAAVGA
jgi:hypothetical protein